MIALSHQAQMEVINSTFKICEFTGLSELGTEVIKAFIIPKIRAIGERIELYLDGTGQANADRIAASHIKQLTIVRLSFKFFHSRSKNTILIAESYGSYTESDTPTAW